MNRLSATLVAGLLLAVVVPGVASAAGNSVIYSSLVSSPLHGNMPSLGAEAYAFSELGNAVAFSNSQNRSLSNVVVTMSSWGCQSGHWYSGDCVTTPGATFAAPITFNVYQADGTTIIATATQTFAIPYRPSASTKCTGDQAGKWFDNALKTCFNGFATNITFNFNGQHLDDSVVFGIAYNTTHYGLNPIGPSTTCPSGGCGYDSLNVALSQHDPIAGVNTTADSVWQNSSWAGAYCDNGLAGTGTFRVDSGCWAPYTPAVQFKAAR